MEGTRSTPFGQLVHGSGANLRAFDCEHDYAYDYDNDDEGRVQRGFALKTATLCGFPR